MQNTPFTFIDLFAGIGGFRIALQNLGGRCVGFSEVDADAISTYRQNFLETPESNFGDVTKIKALPQHDLLTGGVPCQSWSIAGKNLGFDDDRGQLWNDTLYLLHQSKPKAFIFENVKGLADPRNQQALSYILRRIREAGYFASYYVLNSFDYGVPQSRVRLYIVGFRDERYFEKFKIPEPLKLKKRLSDIIVDVEVVGTEGRADSQRDLFGDLVPNRRMFSLSNTGGFNDYFLFNDIRNGHTTIHSWDILETTERQKEICYLLLRSRRKKLYGHLDGNPLSLAHFKALDKSISQVDLDELVSIGILKPENYAFTVTQTPLTAFTDEETLLLSFAEQGRLNADLLTSEREIRKRRISVSRVLDSLVQKGAIVCDEVRYDFRFTKISTGLFGVNRVFLPTSDIFPTLVASDANDFITPVSIAASTEAEFRRLFLKEVYRTGKYRKINHNEACRVQGFPPNFILPESRSRWMKLIGNSVSIPVVETIAKAIVETRVFDRQVEGVVSRTPTTLTKTP